MNTEHLHTLEYGKIIEQLAERTAFSAGRELALALLPSSDADVVARRIQETSEARHLLDGHPRMSVGSAHDVRKLARRAALEAILEPSELMDIRSTVRSARALYRELGPMRERYPLLAAKARDMRPLTHLIDAIDRCLDEDGRILDSASPELARIRRESARARQRLLDRLHGMVQSASNARYLQEPIVTQRNGRYVIPLKAEYRGRIPGIIQDESSSGATLFIEPLATVELNNRWHELQIAEKREIERILQRLTNLVGQEADNVIRDVILLAELDLAFAKGRYGAAIKGSPAELTPAEWPMASAEERLPADAHPLYLRQARHPLLNAEQVVPIDIYSGGSDTVLVITGPNTGGKTVALKTVGLLSAMSQAGLHIPAGEGSRLPVFDGIYADIGDEQSIEQSLSTFSSHMTHIIDILKRADERSLVLLDELGAGTDPIEGAALAQSLIVELLERGSLLFCSSHYSQLKIFAYNTPGVQNASVEFDVETLAPTFHLSIGLPGRSNAFAIAGRLGLVPSVIDRARELVSSDAIEADVLLAEVKKDREAARGARLEAEAARERAVRIEEELKDRLGEIEAARREVLAEARERGRQEVETLRQELRRIRRDLPRQAQAKESLEQIERTLEELDRVVAPPESLRQPERTPTRELAVGDRVYVSSVGQVGELRQLEDGQAEVAVGGLKLRTERDNLEFRGHSEVKPPEETKPAIRHPQVSSPGVELDLRGFRAEEAQTRVARYLDDAYLAAMPWVHIIHGKGTGVLKKVVRELLRDHPLVASYRRGELGEGGDGVTVVKLEQKEG